MAIEVAKVEGGVDLHLWIPKNKIEGQAVQQLENIARLPWACHVSVMAN